MNEYIDEKNVITTGNEEHVKVAIEMAEVIIANFDVMVQNQILQIIKTEIISHRDIKMKELRERIKYIEDSYNSL